MGKGSSKRRQSGKNRQERKLSAEWSPLPRFLFQKKAVVFATMGHGGGGRINKPKSALCKMNLRKEKKVKVKALKKLSSKGRSDETLGDTTVDILRQCRTNPKANVRLSGKKKKLLLKEAKRLMKEQAQMEITDSSSKDQEPGSSEMETS